MDAIILPPNSKGHLQGRFNPNGTSALAITVKTIREHLMIGLPECMRALEKDRIEIPAYVSAAQSARLVERLDKLLPGTAALNTEVAAVRARNNLEEGIFILRNALDVDDPHHVKEMLTHALRFLDDHKKHFDKI